MGIRLSIDWISATSKRNRVSIKSTAHPALHDWENWTDTNGVNGYTVGAKHESGTKIYENLQRPDMGKHIIYSGKTLQRINKMYNVGALEVLKHHIDSGHNIARIDLALDFIGHNITVDDFQYAFLKGQVKTRLRSASMIKSLTDKGHTFYIGSRKKRKKLVRVYDKSAEMGWDFSCTRVEVQVMGKPATKIGLLAINGHDVGKSLLGAMRDVVDFLTIPEWNQAMENAEFVKIGTGFEEVGDTLKWLNGSVRSSIIKHAVLDVNWWVQYKMDIDRQVMRQIEQE